MVVLRKIPLSPFLRYWDIRRLRPQYHRVLLGLMCLIVLLAVMLAFPTQVNRRPAYLNYSDIPAQPITGFEQPAGGDHNLIQLNWP